MFKLYGKKTRCLWCGKTCDENYREIVMAIKFAKPPQEKAIVCSEECGKKVLDTCKFVERTASLFLVGVVFGSILTVYGLFTPSEKSALPISILGIIGMTILGITFIVFPFVTPQTTKIFGLKRGMLLGRIGGFILLLLAMIIEFILIQSTKCW